ncbi:unnamed protein product [Clonostachys rosea f. rosea IK726]|uniref:Uncharacterized protein n=1 Tax=Clonostachys rosea f. rosea IK726 TaxID=1349383 RepID=A0ACA9TB20_BIOOC|nr:unnamed protein product [Clonostachys rosea f. rosea IK726]
MDSLFNEVFTSAEAAKVACDKYAKGAGFALIIRNTKRHEDGRIQSRVLSCCKARAYQSYYNPNTHPSKRRSSNTQKTSCPFRLWIKATGNDSFVIQPAQNTTYNHAFEDPSSFSTFRNEMILRFEDQIISMHKAGLSPIQITVYIDQQIEKARAVGQAVTDIFPRDISNVISRYREKRLDAGLELLKKHPDLLLLDCTYKTNRFNMLLLNICGVTGTNKTFTIASIFLNNEVEATYKWALSTLLDVMEEYDIPMPRVTVTDRELALINGIKREPRLAQSVNLLCLTAYALKILEEEYRAVEIKPRNDILFISQGCVCEKAVTWGLPCRHIIHSRLVNNRTLTLDDFDDYWIWKSYRTDQTAPFEPVTVRGKGRPVGSLNLDKTRNLRRDPLSHEVAVAIESLEARIPPSTAPASLETPQITGLAHIRQFGDTLKPGTVAPRRAQALRCRTPPDEAVIVTREAEPIVESQDAEGESLTDIDLLITAQQYDIRAEEEEEDSTDDWDDIHRQQETQEEITCDLSDPKFLP